MPTAKRIALVLILTLAGGAMLRAQAPFPKTPLQLAQATGRDKSRLKGKAVDPKAERKKLSNTLITMELITVGDGVALKAHEWSEIIGKLDVTLTIRPGRAGEKLEITERKTGGTLRTVTVKGMLDNRGQLIFSEQTFSPSDAGKLAAWIADLRTYGAKGNPDGRPVWGLTKEQFVVIHTALKKPVAMETKDVELSKVLDKFTFPDDAPLRFSTTAAKALKGRDAPVLVGQSLQGVSQGTALAIILAEQGLAFRPRRLPDGNVELTVTAADEADGAWPIGWPRRDSPPETAPTLFDIKPINLEDEPLDGILEAASEIIGIPILIDRPAMAAKGIDLAKVKITQPRKQMAWTTALGSFTFKAKAKFELLIDEAGKPFLWVTPLASPARQQKE